jgi:hypothetical protein
MKTYVHNSMFMAVAMGLLASPLAMATDINAGNNYKAWTNFGRSSGAVATRSYRAAAPMIVRSESAPATVAQAPTTTRAYSYEPSTQAATSTACGGNATAAPAAKETQKTTGTARSHSYEPATSAPASATMRGRSASRGESSFDAARRATGWLPNTK